MNFLGKKRPFIAHIWIHRHLIGEMAKRDFFTRYTGTAGGVVWAILHPLATVFTFWFVFAILFKAKGPNNVPFTLYLVIGLLPWLTFNEVITVSTNAVLANSFLIKKTVFPSEILPLVYIASAALSHMLMFVIVLALILVSRHPVSIYIVQTIYYMGAMSFFVLGLSWLLSALNAFFRDIGQLVTVALNIWFWWTPIVWSLDLIPQRLHWLIYINPMTYVVEGYRKSLLYQVPFWMDKKGAIYFWVVSIVCFGLGAWVFRRLKPEFPDVL